MTIKEEKDKKKVIELVKDVLSMKSCTVKRNTRRITYIDIHTYSDITYKLLIELSKLFNTDNIEVYGNTGEVGCEEGCCYGDKINLITLLSPKL